MNKDLKGYKSDSLHAKRCTLVLGNESGDLDSVASAVLLAWHESNKHSDVHALPILAFPRADLPLKTEVTKVFEKEGLSLDHVVCLDELEVDKLHADTDLMLVDHNVINLPELQCLDERVVEVYDHHKNQRPEKPRRKAEKVVIQNTGSCTSIIANKIIKERPFNKV